MSKQYTYEQFVRDVDTAADNHRVTRMVHTVPDLLGLIRDIDSLIAKAADLPCPHCDSKDAGNYDLLQKHHNNDHHNGKPAASWYKDMPGFGDQEIEIMHGHDPYEAYEQARKDAE